MNGGVDDYDDDTWSESDQANFRDDEMSGSEDDDSIDAFDEEEY